MLLVGTHWYGNFGKLFSSNYCSWIHVCLMNQQFYSWVYTQQECIHVCSQKTCTRIFTAIFFVIASNWKQSKCPTIVDKEWIRKSLYTHLGNTTKKWNGMNCNTRQQRWILTTWCWGKEAWHKRELTACVYVEVQKHTKAIPSVRSKDSGSPWLRVVKTNSHVVSF